MKTNEFYFLIFQIGNQFKCSTRPEKWQTFQKKLQIQLAIYKYTSLRNFSTEVHDKSALGAAM